MCEACESCFWTSLVTVHKRLAAATFRPSTCGCEIKFIGGESNHWLPVIAIQPRKARACHIAEAGNLRLGSYQKAYWPPRTPVVVEIRSGCIAETQVVSERSDLCQSIRIATKADNQLVAAMMDPANSLAICGYFTCLGRWCTQNISQVLSKTVDKFIAQILNIRGRGVVVHTSPSLSTLGA